MEIKIKIVERLKELMKNYNVNQSQLAEAIGVSQSSISGWVTGKKEPSIESLWKLANYFDETVDYLIGRTET